MRSPHKYLAQVARAPLGSLGLRWALLGSLSSARRSAQRAARARGATVFHCERATTSNAMVLPASVGRPSYAALCVARRRAMHTRYGLARGRYRPVGRCTG